MESGNKFSCIGKQFVKCMSAKSRKFAKFESSIKDFSKFRVLKICHCDNLDYVSNLFSSDDFWMFMMKSSYCFVLIIEVDEADEDIFIFMENVRCTIAINRPLLVQLQHKNSFTMFVKPSLSVEFKVLRKKLLQRLKYSKTLPAGGEFTFENLFHLNHGFDEDLLSFSMNTGETFDGLSLLDFAVERGDEATVRFLLLFHPGEPKQETIETAAKYGTPAGITALLNLPMEEDGKLMNLNAAQRSLINFRRESDRRSLVSMAAERGSCETIEFLIRFGADPSACDFSGCNASDYAIVGRRFENLLTLLRNDAPFPHNFKDVNETYKKEINGTAGLAELIKEREEFYESIRCGFIEEVKEFVESNPQIKIAHSPTNATALSSALEHEKFDVYAYLRYKQFNDDNHEHVRKSLGTHQLHSMTVENQKYFAGPIDEHVLFLYSKSKFAFGDNNNNYRENFIRALYKKLNSIREVAPILKVIKHSKALTITFDFNQRTVKEIDFTSSNRTLGICYYQSGRIYIGARRPEVEIMGTLAHELTHFAMQILFGNDCVPFDAGDRRNRKIFPDIVDEYSRMDHECDWVSNVFASYPKAAWVPELIAVVPQLIAMDMTNVLNQNYPQLYDFYLREVLTKAEALTSDPIAYQTLRDLQQLNSKLGYFDEIKSVKEAMFLTRKEFHKSKLRTNDVKIFVTIAPKLMVENAYQTLCTEMSTNAINSKFLFAKLSHFSLPEMAKEICNLSQHAMLIIDCENFDENLIEKVDNAQKFIIVCDSGETAERIKKCLPDREVEVINITYSWFDLTRKAQSQIFMTEVSFQDSKLQLREMISRKSSPTTYLPVAEVFRGKTFNIGPSIPTSRGYDIKYFVERTFTVVEKHKRRIFEPKHFEKFFSLAKFHRMMIISDDAGMGKSTVLSHIALKTKKLLPDHWIVKVNLYEHIEALKLPSEAMKDINLVEFLLEHFVDAKNDFERKLFRSLFDAGKVVVMLDGFDEICPDYKESCIALIRKLRWSPIAPIWITTRPHEKLELEREFDQTSVELKLFTKSNQFEFLKKYWTEKLNCEAVDEKKLNDCAWKLVRRVSESISDEESMLIGIPLQARMLAEIFEDDVASYVGNSSCQFKLPENFDIFFLYREFVARKIQIARRCCQQELSDFQIISYHEKVALKLILKVKFPTKEEDKLLPKYGIVSINFDAFPHFTHRTFAEYFVASFLIRKIHSVDFLRIISTEHDFDVVVNFIDSAMKHDMLKYLSDVEIHTKISSLLDDHVEPNDTFMHRLIWRENIFLVEFLLKCFQLCLKKTSRRLLLTVNDNGNNIFHLAAKLKVKCLVESIWSLIVKVFTRSEVKKFFLIKNRLGQNVIQLAFQKPFFDQSDYGKETLKVHELHQKFVISDKLRELKLSRYNFYMQNSTLNKLSIIASEILTKLERRDVIFAGTSVEPINFWWSKSLEHRDDYKFFLQHLASSIDLRWKFVQSLGVSNTSDAFFHFHNVFTNFLEGCMKIRASKDQHILAVFMWVEKRFSNKIFSTKVAFKTFVFKYFADAFENVLSEQTALKILALIMRNLSEDDFGTLISANTESFIKYHNIGIYAIWKICSKLFTPEKLKILLVGRKENNFNFLHTIIRRKHHKLLRSVFKVVEEKFDQSEIFTILKLTHKNEMDLLDFAMMSFDNKTFRVLTNFMAQQIPIEYQSQLISSHAIRLCASEQRDGAMCQLLEFLDSLRPGLFREFLLTIDENNRIISLLYHMLKEDSQSSWNRSKTITTMTSLFKYAKIQIDNGELKSVKFQRNSQGRIM